jgi:L-aminopeptidase/D-esterase-like protein
MKGLTDVPGILTGHAEDASGLTGCTVILCGATAVGGVDVRGSATGSVELDALSPGSVDPNVHGIVFSGGSAFGLDASGGVRLFLERKGIGFSTEWGVVPIVPGAVLFDLPVGKRGVRPTREMGEKAAASANNGPVVEGNFGAGAGATVGKIAGTKQAMKSGVGSASVSLGSGVIVSALVAVNAFGDVIDPSTGKIVAGARKSASSREFLNTAALMRHGAASLGFGRTNTTLVVVATNARLDKVQANKLAALGSLGVARSINPVNTMSDGDITFAISLGKEKATIDEVGVAASEVVAMAILRAVRAAKSVAGIPGLAG